MNHCSYKVVTHITFYIRGQHCFKKELFTTSISIPLCSIQLEVNKYFIHK